MSNRVLKCFTKVGKNLIINSGEDIFRFKDKGAMDFLTKKNWTFSLVIKRFLISHEIFKHF